jgi:hypothetical protein
VKVNWYNFREFFGKNAKKLCRFIESLKSHIYLNSAIEKKLQEIEDLPTSAVIASPAQTSQQFVLGSTMGSSMLIYRKSKYYIYFRVSLSPHIIFL